MGADSMRDGITLQEQKTTNALVMASEIMRLPDRTGYLVRSGEPEVLKVSYDYRDREKKAAGFEEHPKAERPVGAEEKVDAEGA